MPRLREKKFRGIDLNEGNVQAIFKQCLSISNPANAIYIQLFRKQFGYEQEDNGIVFDTNKIKEQKIKIEFLYGQLKANHDHQVFVAPNKVPEKYNGESWCNNNRNFITILLFR